MSEIYVVIGPPRSGKTLVAGILHNCGVPAFPSTQSAIYNNAGTPVNPHGHYADADFQELTGAFLSGWSLPQQTWTPSPADIAHIESLVSIRSQNAKWCLNGFYSWIGAKVLADLGHAPKLIRVDRSLADCQASFAVVAGPVYAEDSRAFVSSCAGECDSFYNSFTGDKMAIGHQALFDDPESAVSTLAQFAGVQPTPQAIQFVDQSLRGA